MKREDTTSALNELRRLLLAPQDEALKRLENRVSDLATVLPKVIQEADAHDAKALTEALLPPLERGLGRALERNSDLLMTAVSPVIGPAIRRAIANALRDMVASLNYVLEASLTARGLRWRLEAFRTGRSVAEVALLHSLIFRVEQVFLIHRQAGLVLQHVQDESADARDPDLVSAMLTAIRDFVKDSFSAGLEGQSDGPGRDAPELDALAIGEFSVLIETQKDAILAVVVRGSPPPELRVELIDTLDSVYLRLPEALQRFEGDAAPFEVVRPRLEALIVRQVRPSPPPRLAIFFLIFSALVLTAGLVWGALYFWPLPPKALPQVIKRLNETPGVALLHHDWSDGRLHLTGLLDPLAPSPTKLIESEGLSIDGVDAKWHAWQAPELALLRARHVLAPKNTVQLSIKGTTLKLEGQAPGDFIRALDRLPLLIAGIDKIDRNALKNSDKLAFDQAAKTLQDHIFLFSTGTATPSDPKAADESFQKLESDLRTLDLLATKLQQSFIIDITGRADTSGTERINLTLSEKRAKQVFERLRPLQLRALRFSAKGIGTTNPLLPRADTPTEALGRSVVLSLEPQ